MGFQCKHEGTYRTKWYSSLVINAQVWQTTHSPHRPSVNARLNRLVTNLKPPNLKVFLRGVKTPQLLRAAVAGGHRLRGWDLRRRSDTGAEDTLET